MSTNRELVKRLAELVDGDTWVVADLLAEVFPVEDYPLQAHARNNLHAELVNYEEALRRDHGVILAATTMRIYRATAIAWPDEVRTSSASFQAHEKLRGPDRFGKMEQYLRKNKGRALSKRDVMRYRADEKPAKPMKPFPVRARRRLESTAKSLLVGGGRNIKREDWWNSEHVSAEQKQQLIKEMRSLASEMNRAPADDFDGDNPGVFEKP